MIVIIVPLQKFKQGLQNINFLLFILNINALTCFLEYYEGFYLDDFFVKFLLKK